MGTIICRIGFCEACFKEKRAKTNQKLLLFGSSSNALKAVLANHNGRTGFVPHLYKLGKVVDDKIFYQRVCCICGHYSGKEGEKNFLYLDEEKWSTWRRTSLSNWNSLVLFKDTGFEV